MVTVTLWVQSDIFVQRQWIWLLWHCEYSLTYWFKGGEHGYCDTVNTVWHIRSKAVNMVTVTLWIQSDILDQGRWTWLLWHCEYSLTYSIKGGERGYGDTVNTVWHIRSKAVNMVTVTLWIQSDILDQRRWTWLLWHCEYSLTYSIKGGEHGYSDTVSTVWHARSKAVNMVTLTLWVQSDILVQWRWTW
jgi:hypothetical protein